MAAALIILCWIVTILGVCAGAITMLQGLATATGAPQQAAAAVIGVAFAVVPYCFTRAVSEITREVRDGNARNALVLKPESKEVEQPQAAPEQATSASSAQETPWDDPSWAAQEQERLQRLKERLEEFRTNEQQRNRQPRGLEGGC